MWALIMTIKFFTTYDYESYVVDTLQGFTSEQSCRYAGAQQEVALRNNLKIDTSKKYTFICVKKGE